MSDERAAWMDAIRADPENDGLRLICADWFEEQGTESDIARADFIRTQISRSQLAPEDPRQSPLEAHELRLLKRWASDWCEGTHSVFKKCRFRRGFIEFVHLHLKHFQHHRRAMFRLEPVRDVRLTGWDRAPDHLIERVAKCEEWKHVETLRIHQQGIRGGWHAYLFDLLESAPLTNLRSLPTTLPTYDNGADLRQRLIALPVFRKLRELVLPECALTELAEDKPETWTEIRSLRCHVSTIPHLRRLIEMPFWSELTGLDLQGVFTEEVVEILTQEMPPHLTDLSLTQQPGTAPTTIRSDPFVQALANLPLESLSFTGRGFADVVLPALLITQTNWGLKRLRLYCDLSTFHFRPLRWSSSLTQLSELDLMWSNNLTQEGAMALFSSENLRSLTHLRTGYRVPAQAMKFLAHDSGWNRLRTIESGQFGCTEGELIEILRGPFLQNLTWLRMCERRDHPDKFTLTHEMAEAFLAMPHLAGLQFEMNRLDPEAKQLFERFQDRMWQWIRPSEEYSTQRIRDLHSPANCPPLDEAMRRLGGWQNR